MLDQEGITEAGKLVTCANHAYRGFHLGIQGSTERNKEEQKGRESNTRFSQNEGRGRTDEGGLCEITPLGLRADCVRQLFSWTVAEWAKRDGEGSRLGVCVYSSYGLPAAQFTPQGRICTALRTCTYSTDVACNLPCGHSTSGEGLLTRNNFFYAVKPARRTTRKGPRGSRRETVKRLQEKEGLVDVHFSGVSIFSRNAQLFRGSRRELLSTCTVNGLRRLMFRAIFAAEFPFFFFFFSNALWTSVSELCSGSFKRLEILSRRLILDREYLIGFIIL